MKFYSIRELRANTTDIQNTLSKEGKALITNNGKPFAVMVPVNEENLEEVMDAIQQVEFTLFFNEMRDRAEKTGYLTEAEIEAEIADARKQRTAARRS